MDRTEFLAELDSLLDLPDGALKGPEILGELEQWNSMAAISFIALDDTNNGVRISAGQIANCATVADLLALAGFEKPS
jgi:hypothetical protein